MNWKWVAHLKFACCVVEKVSTFEIELSTEGIWWLLGQNFTNPQVKDDKSIKNIKYLTNIFILSNRNWNYNIKTKQ